MNEVPACVFESCGEMDLAVRILRNIIDRRGMANHDLRSLRGQISLRYLLVEDLTDRLVDPRARSMAADFVKAVPEILYFLPPQHVLPLLLLLGDCRVLKYERTGVTVFNGNRKSLGVHFVPLLLGMQPAIVRAGYSLPEAVTCAETLISALGLCAILRKHLLQVVECEWKRLSAKEPK